MNINDGIIEFISKLKISTGLDIYVLDENEIPVLDLPPIKIPPMSISLAKGTNSRSTTNVNNTPVTVIPILIDYQRFYLILLGSTEKDNVMDLLKFIFEEFV